MQTSVYCASIGCRTNQEEIALLERGLCAAGFAIAAAAASADIIIVNSCSVTAAAEGKTRRLLQALARAAPQARIAVTGCLAQQKPRELLGWPGVAWVAG
ncbi:MAG: hypothetical protein PHC61_17260, partial [Chitinivibrionales bacterium]|nr:hypothetical protein [Chitinivibrionales bacterium]